jgi:hypothetical protein
MFVSKAILSLGSSCIGGKLLFCRQTSLILTPCLSKQVAGSDKATCSVPQNGSDIVGIAWN